MPFSTDEEDNLTTSEIPKKAKSKDNNFSAPLKLSFKHPNTEKDILIFLDPSHIVQLLWHCLGDKDTIYEYDGLFLGNI